MKAAKSEEKKMTKKKWNGIERRKWRRKWRNEIIGVSISKHTYNQLLVTSVICGQCQYRGGYETKPSNGSYGYYILWPIVMAMKVAKVLKYLLLCDIMTKKRLNRRLVCLAAFVVMASQYNVSVAIVMCVKRYLSALSNDIIVTLIIPINANDLQPVNKPSIYYQLKISI